MSKDKPAGSESHISEMELPDRDRRFQGCFFFLAGEEDAHGDPHRKTYETPLD